MKKKMTNYYDYFDQKDLDALDNFLEIPENIEESTIDDDDEASIKILDSDNAILFDNEANAIIKIRDDEAVNPVQVEPVVRRLSKYQALDHRHAVNYFYCYLYGSPPEDQWEDLD